MSQKIATDSFPSPSLDARLVVVREYDQARDKVMVEELERQCEVGQRGKPKIVTDLMGDPICRIRNFPLHVMLVAEYGKEREIVGVIRGCIKSVTATKNELPVYVKMACILGLRVSAAHRRLGIGTKLVQQLENWCRQNGADYTYMATECTNQPSINLFTKKCGYLKFRSPTVLVQPVHAHNKQQASSITLVRVSPDLAGLMYRHIFADSEFFPEDVDLILNNKLNLGTFMALSKKCLSSWDPKSNIIPPNFALLSIWNTKEVFRLKVEGISSVKNACCKGSRVLDSFLPWLGLPSIPNVFKHFGFYFLFGIHMEGNNAPHLMKSLCNFAHNLASKDKGCGALVAEVSLKDPVREAIPHWRKFSWDDLWCIKKLKAAKEEANDSSEPDDWIKPQVSSSVTFVDPRDF